jgi:hypothetical protein
VEPEPVLEPQPKPKPKPKPKARKPSERTQSKKASAKPDDLGNQSVPPQIAPDDQHWRGREAAPNPTGVKR